MKKTKNATGQHKKAKVTIDAEQGEWFLLDRKSASHVEFTVGKDGADGKQGIP
jgi:hypothetical protein